MVQELKKERVVVGMSGGVDSSVAAALLLEQGYDVIGITMKTYHFDEVGGNAGNETSCCGLDAFNDARMVAVQLGIPHYVVDFTREFGTEVIDNSVAEYLDGRTPNPCIICNRKIKWGALLDKARALGASRIATGHYARLGKDRKSGRITISRPVDRAKDQTYALWGVRQEALAQTLFPLGGLTKPQVREIAARHGLKTAAKEESFEICFVADDDYRRFLRERVPDIDRRIGEGNILLDGKPVGQHQGYPFYTIGQRSGLGAFGERVYVSGIDPARNTVAIGRNDDLLRSVLIVKDLHLVSIEMIDEGMPVEAQVRYKDTPAPAHLYPLEDGRVRVEFTGPKRAITPGQSFVFYVGEDLGGGGIIERTIDHSPAQEC
jgi:tRNA-specific 2-thiouridylase